MIEFELKSNVKKPEHILVITDKFQNAFGLPEKVTDYFESRFKTTEKGKVNAPLAYNYIGTYISVYFPDSKKEKHQLAEDVRKHGAAVTEAINAHKGESVFIYNQTSRPELSLFAAEGVALAAYSFENLKTTLKQPTITLKKVAIVDDRITKKEIDELATVCEATSRARDLVNEPVNRLNATDLANAFISMGKKAGFNVEVFNKKKIRELKMGGLLAVNAGSVDDPSFTVMTYKPKTAVNKKPFVLVGKGVVYDTGGLSLKPTANSMDLMKCDMAGGAAVGAALYAIAKMKLPVHVIGLVPATDNRPGFNAFAPGDVITMMDGSTVEMLNSDAEGRMILADALHYAKRFSPELAIDIATLTGAAAAAIGPVGIVGMGNIPQSYRTALHDASYRVFERIAEFPFWDEYNDQLKSDIADQKNIGSSYAGAITAGKFLAKFTDYPYYHLDIAGPSFLTSKESYRGKGGTGVGVRLFYEFFKQLSKK